MEERMNWLLIIALAHEGGATLTTTMTTEAQCRAAVDAIEASEGPGDWTDNDAAWCIGPDGTVYAAAQ
jgi:hypothetical protein